MVQKEFAEKLLSNSTKKRKAVSIIANYAFEIKNISKVGKNNFSPPPKVDSVILKIIQKNIMTKDQIQTINKIFSYRRKTVKNILKQFNKETELDTRVDDLSGDEIIHLANQILEK
jgi:16S rRNA (adenine1518-N6/adenine1519-N6)-dimethyltransferase